MIRIQNSQDCVGSVGGDKYSHKREECAPRQGNCGRCGLKGEDIKIHNEKVYINLSHAQCAESEVTGKQSAQKQERRCLFYRGERRKGERIKGERRKEKRRLGRQKENQEIRIGIKVNTI